MVMNFSKKPQNKEINYNKTRMWKRKMNIGKWNVRSLFWSGAIKVLHNESSKVDSDVVTLQEIKLGSGIQKFDNFTLFNSGAESKKHEFGHVFYVREAFLKYVRDFKIINERICYFRLKAKWFSCTLIHAHTPTNKKTEEVKAELYNLLQQNINLIANSNIKIILGDFNAKVSKEDIYTNPPLATNVYIMKPTTTE
jgi:exonuclease III